MFSPQIILFTFPQVSVDQTQILNTLRDNGFEPMVDSVHTKDYHWFQKNFSNTPHKFFFVSEEVQMFSVSDLDPEMYYTPSFSVNYNNDETLTEHDWRILHRYFQHMMFPLSNKPKLVSRRVHQLLAMPMTQSAHEMTDEGVCMDTQEDNGYEFDMEVLEQKNVCLCTVTKPFVDGAYTVVIRDFSERGLKPFFTDLFIVRSWGVSRYDVEFLKQLWTHLGFTEPFDLDQMLKEATEACIPSPTKVPEPEPTVYRKSLSDTKRTLQDREEGRLFKKFR